MSGKAWRGSDVSFGDYGLKALEPCWLTARQIEAARVAMTRFIKRGGKIWVRVFPDKPITKKPQETRMGKGKGAPEQWVCGGQAGPRPVRDGGRDARRDARAGDEARRRQAAHPHQVRDPVRAGEGVMKVSEQRDALGALDRALGAKERELADQLFRMRIQKSMGQLEAPEKLRHGAPRSGPVSRRFFVEQAGVGGNGDERKRQDKDRHRRQQQDGRRASSLPSSGRCATASTARPSAGPPSSWPTTKRSEAKIGDTRGASSNRVRMSRRKRWALKAVVRAGPRPGLGEAP